MTLPPIELGAVQRIVAEARRLEAAGQDVVRLDIGEPDFPTPPHIIEAGVRALRDGETRYVAPAGLPTLRAAVASSVAARGIVATPEQVVITAGARAMLWYALLALVRAGDDVLVPDPGYPGYATAIRLAGGTPVPYAMRCDDGRFWLDADALRAAITPCTRVLVVNAPQNPTGAVLDSAALAAIASVAQAHDLWVVSDEIYSSLCHDAAPAPSIASLPEMATRTVLVDGFSKTYAMTGWRLGYGVMPVAIAATVTSLVSECATCTPAFVQHAGIAALAGPHDAVSAMRAAYGARTRLLANALRAIGLVAAPPAGAFYVFADASPLLADGLTTTSLADTLLREHGVACVPGSAYGARGAACLRFACTTSEARLAMAVARIARAAAARAVAA